MVVLTGHGIGMPPSWMRDADPEMWITQEQFASALQFISSEVHLTFDDGFSCCWDIAFPELRNRGLSARFFVLAGMLGTRGYLAPEQLVEMSSSGMTIGTHGMHHRPWRKLSASMLHEEINEAKDRLECLLGKPVTEAACPFGAYDRRALHALKRSGIQRVYTSDRAIPDPNSWIIPRYTIRRSDSENYVEEVVRGLHHASLIGKVKMFVKRFR